jgi:hypothetical protein
VEYFPLPLCLFAYSIALALLQSVFLHKVCFSSIRRARTACLDQYVKKLPAQTSCRHVKTLTALIECIFDARGHHAPNYLPRIPFVSFSKQHGSGSSSSLLSAPPRLSTQVLPTFAWSCVPLCASGPTDSRELLHLSRPPASHPPSSEGQRQSSS